MINLKHLGDFIIQEGFDDSNVIERVSSRAIIINEKKEVLLIHSSFYDDATFPGGGVDEGENLIVALKRECLEEVGCVIDSYKDFCMITEKRAPSKTVANVFTSYYYICTYNEMVEPSLLDYEIKLGYSSVWYKIDDAIKLNEKTLGKLIRNNKYTGVVERELRVLHHLKEVL